MNRLPETCADGARTDAPYPDCVDRVATRSNVGAGRGDGEASNRAVDVEKKHTATSGGWGFSPFGDRRSIHRTDAHAQTARPAALKKTWR